ncbi:hypothetical protein [Streptomyces sp. NBC_01708]|uniref:hypothetical protein n=1 Tax=Streptomyces sp. NBC_01708 TaxID=2975915 RepID=UPI002E2F4761|nr:hypothetical protein [Streptomyces sp. NBC_01708]
MPNTHDTVMTDVPSVERWLRPEALAAVAAGALIGLPMLLGSWPKGAPPADGGHVHQSRRRTMKLRLTLGSDVPMPVGKNRKKDGQTGMRQSA